MPELLISDEQAVAHLNLAPGSEVDEDLAQKMEAAQAIVLDYITSPDATWTVDTVPAIIRQAILLQLGELYVYRGDDPDPKPREHGFLSPVVVSLLHRYRDPVVS